MGRGAQLEGLGNQVIRQSSNQVISSRGSARGARHKRARGRKWGEVRRVCARGVARRVLWGVGCGRLAHTPRLCSLSRAYRPPPHCLPLPATTYHYLPLPTTATKLAGAHAQAEGASRAESTPYGLPSNPLPATATQVAGVKWRGGALSQDKELLEQVEGVGVRVRELGLPPLLRRALRRRGDACGGERH